MPGIEKEGCGWDSNNVTDGIGQMPVVYMIRIDKGSISESQKETENETCQRQMEIKQPFFIALFYRRV
ncbi:MAG: hypothetical protein IJ665_06015 [Phocaeicola sp.]|nr:hypothetical protein [Phocaeicola sp.]